MTEIGSIEWPNVKRGSNYSNGASGRIRKKAILPSVNIGRKYVEVAAASPFSAC
jgi:hypothetical protein